MNEIDKKIQEAKANRNNIKNHIREKMTELRIAEAELRMMEGFIDEFNDLKNKMETL